MFETPIENQLEESNLPADSPLSHSVINANTNSVKINEVVGATFLGLLNLILLAALLLSQRRNRQLTAKLTQRGNRLALLERPHRRISHG